MAEIKWAKVMDVLTKECSIGLGDDAKYYEANGYTQQEVEESWYGGWFLKGYAPEKPQSVINEEIIQKDQEFLNETDWYAVRLAETGKPIPAEISAKRQECRDEISRLRS